MSFLYLVYSPVMPSSARITCSQFVSFWIDAWMETVAASGNNQLIEYAYQTLVVYPMLYRYHLILLLYFVIFFISYCYIVLCVYITHCTHIFNHYNDLALNGSLIGNKHICICIVYPSHIFLSAAILLVIYLHWV